LNLKQYEIGALQSHEHEANLREKEIDLACHLKTALANNDEPNLELHLEKE
jgi:hypothetical protein